MTRSGRAALVGLLVAVVAAVAMMAAGHAQAGGSRSISDVPDRSAYVEDTSIGLGASSEAVDFSGLSGWGTASGAYCVCIQNIGSNDLLVQLVPQGTSVAAGQLTTPSNGVASQVDIVSATNDDWVCWNGGKYAGIRWQTKSVAATSARARIQY
jgi:hypothetical protein